MDDLQKMKLPLDGIWLPEATSTMADAVDKPYWLIYWTCVISFILIVAPMFYFMVKYKRRHVGQKALSQVDHSQLLEIIWSAIPLIFFVLIFVWGFRGFMDLQVVPANHYEIQVKAKKWDWTLTYTKDSDGNDLKVPLVVNSKSDAFVIPVGVPVKLLMTSEDVLHSFFVPNFRTKMDVIPGRYTTEWFEATRTTKEGEVFPIFCTEYCGTDHSQMLARLNVVTEKEFDAWLKEKAEAQAKLNALPPTVEFGTETYNKYCVACHKLDGSKVIAPSFKGLYGRMEKIQGAGEVKVDDAYLLESIMNPNAKVVEGFAPAMPNLGAAMSQREIDSVIMFIKAQK